MKAGGTARLNRADKISVRRQLWLRGSVGYVLQL